MHHGLGRPIDPTARARIDGIIQFCEDLTSFRDMLQQSLELQEDDLSGLRLDYVEGRLNEASRLRHERENLRQSLLRRAGPIQVIFERVQGGALMQPQPFNVGPPLNVWQLALHKNEHYNQIHFVETLADFLNTVIGRLEDDPTLLDPPVARTNAGTMLQPINVYGGTVNIAQTGSGDISQQIAPQQGLEEVRQQLDELEAAIRNIGAPEDEIEGFLEPVEQMKSELGKSRPLVSRLTRSWGAIQAIAAIEGTWQNWDRVQRIAAELGPRVHDLIQISTRAGAGG